MSKFTPGPWEVGAKGYGAPGYVYCDNSLGSAVAIVYGAPMRHSVFSRAEEEANARLIAAAPDLLEALQDALCALECCGKVSPVATKASAAIAKATGETP